MGRTVLQASRDADMNPMEVISSKGMPARLCIESFIGATLEVCISTDLSLGVDALVSFGANLGDQDDRLSY
jgi:hypothetical protein